MQIKSFLFYLVDIQSRVLHVVVARHGIVAEAVALVTHGSWTMAGEHVWWHILWDMRWLHLLGVVICKLDEDLFCAALRGGATQGTDGSLCFSSGVVQNKANTLGHSRVQVHQDTGLDDLAVGLEQLVQLHLCPRYWQVADVQVCPLDALPTHTCLGHLDAFVLQLKAVEGLDGPVSV